MASQCQAMVLLNLNYVTFLLSLIQFSYCERRIQGGADVGEDKKYAVYLLKASVSPMRYIGWVCGGAIVTEWFIITSAACVQDVKHLYAIAGYKKYVKAKEVDTDPCTKKTKKKVIFSCVPRSYNFEYLKIDKWAHSDIAVVKVDSKYDFQDKSYIEFCSYIPGPIDINYDGKYQEPGTDTIVLGWGHNKEFRKERDLKIYNEKELKYAPLLVVAKSVCKKAYSAHEKLLNTIDKYMICAYGAGNLDDTGDIIDTAVPKVDGCVTNDQKKKGLRGVSCEVVYRDKGDPYDEAYQSDEYVNDDTARRGLPESDVIADEELLSKEVMRSLERSKKSRNGAIADKPKMKNPDESENKTETPDDKKEDITTPKNTDNNDKPKKKNGDESEEKKETPDKDKADSTTPKNIGKKTFDSSVVGICQNDHGGPLVTWVGAREILIGVATAFIVSNSSQCKGPYLFTSTQCNSAFLDCIINNSSHTSAKRRLCDSPPEIGFEMIRRYISWSDHPAGPAKNEILETRQQISIQQYHFGSPGG